MSKGWNYYTALSGTDIIFGVYNAGNLNRYAYKSAAATIGTVVHVVGVYDTSDATTGCKVYVNGIVSADKQDIADSIRDSASSLWFASSNGAGDWFHGVIDGEVRIYNRALNSTEIDWLYAGTYTNTTGLVLLINATSWNGTYFHDYSGYDNSGPPYGNVQYKVYIGTGFQATYVDDTVNCTQVVTDDSRISIGDSTYLRYYLVLNSSGVICPSGDLYINGTDHTITNGWANFTVTNASVGKNTFVETGINVSGITAYQQTPSNPWVVFDNSTVTAVTFASDGSYDFTVISQYDSATLTHSVEKVDTNTARIYDILYGLNNFTWNLYERSYGASTFKTSCTGNQSITWGTISDTEKKIVFTVTGPTTVNAWLNDLGKPLKVIAGGIETTDWSYDSTLKTFAITLAGTTVELQFGTAEGGVGGGGPTGGSGTVSPINATLPVTLPTVDQNLVSFGVVIIVVVVVLSMLVKEQKDRKSPSKTWAKHRSRKSEVKWKKKGGGW